MGCGVRTGILISSQKQHISGAQVVAGKGNSMASCSSVSSSPVVPRSLTSGLGFLSRMVFRDPFLAG